MKKCNCIDFGNYKIAHVSTNIMEDCEKSHMDVIKLATEGITSEYVTIALIPKDNLLTECGGDDWNDTPAYCNASGFYNYPEGTIFLGGKLGQELKRI